MAERVTRARCQLLGQLHHWLMREAGQHCMFELVELVFQLAIDARVRMAEQIHPP